MRLVRRGDGSLTACAWTIGFTLALFIWKQVVCTTGALVGAPLRMCFWFIVGLMRPVAVWEADWHPTPYAPGVYSANRFDLLGFPVRRVLTTATVVPVIFVMMALQGSGFGQSVVFSDESWLTSLLVQAVITVFLGSFVTLVSIGLMFSPLFAHVESLGRRTSQLPLLR